MQAQIEKHQAVRFHKRDNDAIKQFAANHQTKAALKLKGKKKASSNGPTTTPLPPVASGSSTTLDSAYQPIASTSASDVPMNGPSDAFTLTPDKLLTGYSPFNEDALFEDDTTFLDSLSNAA